MIIDPKSGLNSLNTQQSQRSAQKPAPEQRAADKADKPQGDSVQLSDQAQSMQRLEENIAKAPSVNEDRVAALKAAIADGSYQINAERLADKILTSEGI